MLPFLIKTKEVILDILFPPLCLNCQKHLEHSHEYKNWLCDNCYSSIKLNNTLFCPVCQTRLADNRRICHYNSQYLLAAAGNYDDPVLRNLIHYFKYKSSKSLAPVLGEILVKYLNNLSLSTVNNQKSIIIPIPLHPQRERKRGFNQAELIAKFIAKNLNLRLIDELKRIKNTEAQANLKNNEARIKNIANCFQLKNPELIKNKNIILIDDVFTSGATMNEAVKVLKENSAKRIIALVIAKA